MSFTERRATRLFSTIGMIPAMFGWYLDVLVGYVIRSFIRFVRTLKSEKWPAEKATVSRANCPAATYGGPVAEIAYTYIYKGEYYAGFHSKAFLLRSSAKDYVDGIIIGGQMLVRVDPARPERSVLVE